MDSGKISVYDDYWKRRTLLAGELPHFPVITWWAGDDLSESERKIFEAVRGANRLLDIGAGDQRVRKKLEAAGFHGEYHTQDLSGEHRHTFVSLDAAKPGSYDAVLCIDVLEHLSLEGGLALLQRARDLLAPGGVLVVQTPNARCVRNPLAWDMTHVHCYNVQDLWAYLRTLGFQADGYRVSFRPRRMGVGDRIRGLAGRWVATRLLGCDYADNLLFVGRKPS